MEGLTNDPGLYGRLEDLRQRTHRRWAHCRADQARGISYNDQRRLASDIGSFTDTQLEQFVRGVATPTECFYLYHGIGEAQNDFFADDAFTGVPGRTPPTPDRVHAWLAAAGMRAVTVRSEREDALSLAGGCLLYGR